jgi:competence ComEA-like helix-hairpin-helix protein
MFALAFLYVAVLPAQTQGTAASKTAAKTPSPVQGKSPALNGKTVNLNKATAEDLVKNVPLITPELAKKIVQYRKDNGDFQSVDELLQIDGFTRPLFERIKKFFILEGVGGKDCTC